MRAVALDRIPANLHGDEFSQALEARAFADGDLHHLRHQRLVRRSALCTLGSEPRLFRLAGRSDPWVWRLHRPGRLANRAARVPAGAGTSSAARRSPWPPGACWRSTTCTSSSRAWARTRASTRCSSPRCSSPILLGRSRRDRRRGWGPRRLEHPHGLRLRSGSAYCRGTWRARRRYGRLRLFSLAARRRRAVIAIVLAPVERRRIARHIVVRAWPADGGRPAAGPTSRSRARTHRAAARGARHTSWRLPRDCGGGRPSRTVSCWARYRALRPEGLVRGRRGDRRHAARARAPLHRPGRRTAPVAWTSGGSTRCCCSPSCRLSASLPRTL